jgi:hypothetical protein
LRNIVLQSGLETNNPFAAVQRYVDELAERGLSFHGKHVLVFGYGGRFDIGFNLLKAGASHVVLCDKYASPDNEHNQRLFASEDKYFVSTSAGLRPRAEWMTLLEADIRDPQVGTMLVPVDIVLSNSVYEHLEDVEGITHSLSALTKPDGIHIHFVDLRDHYFKYPFEMLRFSEKTWRRWLNPSSNHNRYRLWNYRDAFNSCFGEVEIKILTRDDDAFQKLLPHIRPEFVSGNLMEDAVKTIRVVASKPLKR